VINLHKAKATPRTPTCYPELLADSGMMSSSADEEVALLSYEVSLCVFKRLNVFIVLHPLSNLSFVL
jgi:hypothetical protein